MSEASRRGRRAKEIGDGFERKFIREFKEATGVELSRQLNERRDGNVGDIQVHPDVPMVFQCRKRKKLSAFGALDDAISAMLWWEKANTHYPVGILEHKEKKRPDDRRRNQRAVVMHEEDVADLREHFRAAGTAGPAFMWVKKQGAKYPRVWDGLEEAQELVSRHGDATAIPGCLGIRSDPELENIVLLEYDGWLHLVGELFRLRLW